jgi:cobaltochelatase CobN
MEESNGVTNRCVAGQLVLCKGCCCGRVERGFPAVPVERIKAAWKAEKLNSVIQLSVSGCLGPCDIANVVAVLSPAGSEWFGLLKDETPYDCLLDWARACKAAESLLPLPASIAHFRFERFKEPRTK